ncbi:MAG: hypothetical protein ACYCV0_00575 [Desulfitobacteriaceae bacterium]
MFDYRRIQAIANSATCDSQEPYAGHRAQTMKSIKHGIKALGRQPQKLIVFGVGNANDLEIKELSTLAPEVWFADIDGETLNNTVERYRLADKVRIWVGDAGGGVEEINRLRTAAGASPQSLEALLAELELNLQFNSNNNPFPEKFDLVVSQCLLSQIQWAVSQTVWDWAQITFAAGQRLLKDGVQSSPFLQLARVLELITFNHVKWLAGILRRGGMLILNTDITWLGIPLYGTDVWRIWQYLAEKHSLKGLLLKVHEEKLWQWELDERTAATVSSTLFMKSLHSP